MSGRLFERTRPVRAGSGHPGKSARGPRGPRGARPTRTVPTPRHQRRRINWTRVTAIATCLILAISLTGLVTGPWLRVRAVSTAGAGWTGEHDLDRVLAPVIGQNLLLVDASSLAAALADLPAVEDAQVEVGLMGDVSVTLTEGGAVALWRTTAAALLLAEDGTVIGVQARTATLRGELADLPVIDDRRDTSHDLTTGDGVPATELAAALALADMAPDAVGSAAPSLTLAVDPTYGFILAAPQAGWQAAFGFYGLDPDQTAASMRARIAAQSEALATLFATQTEAAVAWADVRIPTKVYFRARG